MEKNYIYNQDLSMLLINYKPAYNSIVRGELWIAMENLGTPIKLITVIKSCLQNTKCKINLSNTNWVQKSFDLDKQKNPIKTKTFNVITF